MSEKISIILRAFLQQLGEIGGSHQYIQVSFAIFNALTPPEANSKDHNELIVNVGGVKLRILKWDPLLPHFYTITRQNGRVNLVDIRNGESSFVEYKDLFPTHENCRCIQSSINSDLLKEVDSEIENLVQEKIRPWFYHKKTDKKKTLGHFRRLLNKITDF